MIMIKINSLWVGSPLGHNQNLTIKSHIAQGHEFYLWVYDMDMIVPDCTIKMDAENIITRDDIFQLGMGTHCGSYAFFADQFMMTLLSTEGGWWTGMDVICLQSLQPFEDRDYLFAPHCTSGVGTHLMKSPPNGAILRNALARYRTVFAIDNYDYHAGLRLIYEETCKLGREDVIGSADDFGDDTPPYGLCFNGSNNEWQPSEKYIYHSCFSMTQHQTNNPLPNSFYYKMLKLYGI